MELLITPGVALLETEVRLLVLVLCCGIHLAKPWLAGAAILKRQLEDRGFKVRDRALKSIQNNVRYRRKEEVFFPTID